MTPPASSGRLRSSTDTVPRPALGRRPVRQRSSAGRRGRLRPTGRPGRAPRAVGGAARLEGRDVHRGVGAQRPPRARRWLVPGRHQVAGGPPGGRASPGGGGQRRRGRAGQRQGPAPAPPSFPIWCSTGRSWPLAPSGLRNRRPRARLRQVGGRAWPSRNGGVADLDPCAIEVVTAPDRYLAGQESAVVNTINGQQPGDSVVRGPPVRAGARGRRSTHARAERRVVGPRVADRPVRGRVVPECGNGRSLPAPPC